MLNLSMVCLNVSPFPIRLFEVIHISVSYRLLLNNFERLVWCKNTYELFVHNTEFIILVDKYVCQNMNSSKKRGQDEYVKHNTAVP